MRFTTIGSEKTVDELATRLYGKISKAKSATVVAALTKANPQLGSAPQQGAVIVVPDLPKLPPVKQAEVADPAGQLQRNLAAAVAAFREHLAAAAKANADRAAAEAKLLASAPTKRLLTDQPALDGQRARISEEIKARQAQAKVVQDRSKRPLVELEEGLASANIKGK